MKKKRFKITSFVLMTGLFIQLATAGATAAPAEVISVPTKEENYQKPDQWEMIEPGAGGAFMTVGAGPTGIAIAAGDLSGVYISYDDGKSWENRGQAEGITHNAHLSMVGFDTEDEKLIYVGSQYVMYKSDDKGYNFHPILSKDWNRDTRTGTFEVVRGSTEGYKDPSSSANRLYWTSMTFSKSNPNIGYAAAHSTYNTVDAMIFKTTDRGETWKPVKSFVNEGSGNSLVINADKRILKIIVDHQNPENVYFLTQDDHFTWGKPQTAIYKSTDGGATWGILNGGTDNLVTYSDIDEEMPKFDENGQRVVENGRAASYSEGSTFSEPVLQRHVMDFEIDPVDPNILYASKGVYWDSSMPGSGTYKSTDGGATWTKINDQIGLIKTKAVNNDASKTIVRCIVIGGWEGADEDSLDVANRNYPQVWESADAGEKWEKVAGATNFEYGAIMHWYDANGGFSRTVATSMADPDVYYWADYQWVYMSDDGGKSFRSAGSTVHHEDKDGKWYTTTGVSNVVSFTLKISEADPNIIFIGNADIGLWRSLDNGRSWQHANQHGFLSDWQYYGGQAQAIALDPERPNVVWAGLGGYYEDQVLVKSEDYGKLNTWSESHSGLPKEKRSDDFQPGAVIRGLSIDRTSPKDNRTLYVVADDKVFKSVNDGADWAEVLNMRGTQPPFNYANSLSADRQAATEVDPTDGNFVYAGGADGLFRSTDAGVTWEPTGPSGLKGIQKIVVSRQNPEHVYVAAYGSNQGLYFSSDRGETWTQVLKDNYLRGFAVNPKDDRVIIAGSSNVFVSGGAPNSSGALLSVDGGNTWTQVNDGLSWPWVRDVEFNPHDPSQVFIVTPGTSYHVRAFDYHKYGLPEDPKDPGEPVDPEEPENPGEHVNPNPEALLQMLTAYETSGDIKQPLTSQLRNTAEQIRHHSDKGQMKQAVKSLDDFLKKLNNKPKDISLEAKQALTDYVQSLKNLWK
ncbi:WD40/YVTN/BNR-like repeat-containing protein [Lederbergia citrea]|uniref:WD40/YVTN/BNR-like repeat-containing protein n=1 Tax=Lederbergia citrea TaxID=2833581 RepID=UPI001BCA567E|nr:sialidase family protein [Lederbergia citrea]MBS4205460.1 hypothetical protein [Lederbergia citrea]